MNNVTSSPLSGGPASSRPTTVSDDSYMPPSINVPHLSTREMDELDRTFRARVEESRHASHRLSRQRLWLIFLLLRHGALRLGEVLGLDDEKASPGLTAATFPSLGTLSLNCGAFSPCRPWRPDAAN